MMPISLTLSAFGPYPDTITIDFESFQEDGLFLITGPTGSGKTMIFDAMIFALYGKTSGQIRQTDSLRCDHALNEIPTFVEFSFSLHQQNYTIKRNPKYYLEGKKTPKQPSALLTLPDGKMVEGIKEVNQKMISLLGVDDQQFKQICMIAQGEFTKLIMASSDEREKVLRELFHSETYQKLEEKLKVHLKTYQDKYDLLLNKRKDLMQELQVEDHQEYLSKQTKLIASQQKEYVDLKKDLDQKKQQLQLYRLQNQRLIQLKDLKQQFQDLKKQENDYQKLNKTVDTLKKAQETNYLYISYIKQQKKLQTLKLNQEDFLKQLKKLEKDYQEKKVQADFLTVKQQTKEKLQNQIQETKQLINQIYQYQNDYQNLQTLKQQYRMLDEEHKLFLKKKEKFENGLQRDQERIQSEQQVQSKYELIKQQYVRLNEQKVKVHQLSDYYDQILKLNENKSDLQEEYTVVEKQVDHEKMQYNQMEKLYFRKQAGIFALQLKEDQPCPICGSLHHPHPAQIEKEGITKEKLDQQAKKVKQQEHRLQDILQKILLSNQKKEMLVKQTKQLSSELNIQEEISKEIFIKELDHLSKDEKRMKKEYLELQDELKYIQKLKKSVALSLKDMSTYESKELKQAQSLENIQVQIHQLSGKLDDSLRQYEIGEVNKNYQQVTGNEESLKRVILTGEINRPGFELAGFFKHSDFRRIIVFGDKEMAFIAEMTEERQKEIFPCLINEEVPCIVICKGHACPEVLKNIADERNFPIFQTEMITGVVSSELMNTLEEKLARETLMHGVFLNIHGKGVIIKGDSGIGKSEIALELVKRGHLLVADDAVELYRIGQKIVGKAPAVLANLLEIRGIGVIDVSKMFGISAILDRNDVDLVIQLERWVPSREYTRVGVEENDISEDVLGIKIPKIVVPVSSGRSMSVIIEAAVMNMRLRDVGIDSSKEFVERILKNIDHNKQEQ